MQFTNGNEGTVANMTYDMINNGVHAIIGPDYHCTTSARIAGVINLPVFSYVSFYCYNKNSLI